ncbi:hypothetical protein Taro_010941 [Colocasia esculenta]|uniref:Uncharacterized protein n=1 Tax=Colocasia esculenta TaxID=4460 RepID=A0A843U8G1_COLES|nr:hypothetical protein [Colocasia esculenta]
MAELGRCARKIRQHLPRTHEMWGRSRYPSTIMEMLPKWGIGHVRRYPDGIRYRFSRHDHKGTEGYRDRKQSGGQASDIRVQGLGHRYCII